MRRAIALLVWVSLAGSEVIDRIAVVAGKKVIKASDISRELRTVAFLNGEQPVFTPESRRKAAERLIDQAIIREQILRGGYTLPGEQEADALLQRLRQERFSGVAETMRQHLARYQLTEDRVRRHLLWQITVLRFIEQRFRPGVTVTNEEVRAYYDAHPDKSGFEALEPKIRESLEGERVDQAFTQWLADARKRNPVEYKKEAFE